MNYGVSRITLMALCATAAIVSLQPVALSQRAAARSVRLRYQVLYVFRGGADGDVPGALVLDEAGNLYGTTSGGGAFGHGTVFKLDTTGTHTVHYSFKGGSDGDTPNPNALARDGAGNLYGTTVQGGRGGNCSIGLNGCGVIFKVTKTGRESVMYRFSGGADGATPLNAGLVQDAAGNLYGTTGYGGTSFAGNVFQLDTSDKESVLHSFTGGSDGDLPMASLVLDAAGNLYGTTDAGGSSCGGGIGCGIVFRVNQSARETVLYRFTNFADGGYPDAELVRDAADNLYGTTTAGGTGGAGTVFKVDPSGTETTLHAFSDAEGGTLAGLVRDPAGNLYGTTYSGGDLNCPPPFGGGCGTVFMVDCHGTYTVLHVFRHDGKGEAPTATLARDAAGNLYGTASGVVFKLIP
jgi:uncharacterized repeat protein (TIGR03803 family)